MAKGLSHEEFIEKYSKVNSDIELIGEYINSRTKVDCICKKCGNIWSVKPNHLMRGVGCPNCWASRRKDSLVKSHVQFADEIYKKDPTILLLGKYQRSSDRIKCKCTICGHEWEPIANSLARGSGCPICAHSSTSYGEQFMLLLLRHILDVDVYSRDRKTLGIELDIYVPSLHFAIEFGSFFWHGDKQQKDIDKFELCARNGIDLVIIYDGKCMYNVGVINAHAIVYESIMKDEDFINEITNILAKYNINFCLEAAEIERISYEASMRARRKNTDLFKEEMQSVNNTVEILGTYRDAHKKIECQCRNCGNKWENTPNALLSGFGCPRCANRLRRSHEQFVDDLKNINPDIRVLDKFIDTKTKIEFECRICNYKWSATPHSVLSGRGCPRCSKQFRRTQEEFVREIYAKNNGILILGDFVDLRTKIQCECASCGHKWLAAPGHLLKGHGCPKCAGVQKKTDEDFIYEVGTINKSIKVIGKYVNSKTPIKCQCLKCNYIWSPIPNNLLRGSKCPKCSGRQRRTQQEFVEEVYKLSRNVEIIGEFVNTKTKISCKCNKCGYTWLALPSSLLEGRGCPKCAGVAKKRTKSLCKSS